MVTQELIFEQFTGEAERSLTLGDSLDLKANVWLVVITFLATQTAYFIGKNNLPHVARYGQFLAATLLVVAGILTLIELCPRTYSWFSPTNGAIEMRVAELEALYKDYENGDELTSKQLLVDEIEWAKQRTAQNGRINDFKSRLIVWSFGFAAAAGLINLLTLLYLFKPLFS